MTIYRQRALIRLIANEGGKVSKLRLVKLSFLLRENSQGVPKSSLYEFFPYHYGPYSFTLNYELHVMERNGQVMITDSEVALTPTVVGGALKLDSEFTTEIDSLSRQFRNVSTSDLVASVYHQFPWYTAKAKNHSRRATQVPTGECAVYTVGYEGLMLDGLLDLLLHAGVKRLVDVRCNPVARRFGFHKSTLERHCRDLDIAYLHIPELGIPSAKRSGLGDMKSYDRLFRYYEDSILPANKDLIRSLSSVVEREPSALMCMEADAKCCHRTRLAQAIAKETGLPVKELCLQ
jgi:uncharacterized protein (DUF488 family)